MWKLSTKAAQCMQFVCMHVFLKTLNITSCFTNRYNEPFRKHAVPVDHVKSLKGITQSTLFCIDCCNVMAGEVTLTLCASLSSFSP